MNWSKLREVCLKGGGTAQEQLAARMMLYGMVHPDTDVNAYKNGRGNFEAALVNNLSKTDTILGREMGGARSVTATGTAMSADVVAARKSYELRHQEAAQNARITSGLTDAEIVAIETGATSVTDAQLAAYKVMLESYADSKFDADGYMDSISGDFDLETINNIGMTDADISKGLKDARGPMTDAVRIARKEYEARHAAQMAAVRGSIGFDTEEANYIIQAIESGSMYYNYGGSSKSVTVDHIQAYREMMQRYKDSSLIHADFVDSTGNWSEELYRGITMTAAEGHTNAYALQTSPFSSGSADESKARSTLEYFRRENEGRLYRCVQATGLDSNDVKTFINGGAITLDPAKLQQVFKNIVEGRIR
jgi:hypothetical protein